jgi:hypothetical protein
MGMAGHPREKASANPDLPMVYKKEKTADRLI